MINSTSTTGQDVNPAKTLAPPVNYRLSVAILSIYALCVDTLAVRSISFLAPFLRTALQIDGQQIGYLLAVFLTGTLLITLPIGSILGRLNSRLVFTTIMISVGLLTLVISMQNTFSGLLLVFFLLGILRAGIIPLVNRVIIEHFEVHRRGRILGLVYAAVPLGGFLGAVAMPNTAEFFNWNTSYLVISSMACIGAILFWKLTPPDISDDSIYQPRIRLSSLLTRPFIILSIGYAIFTFSMSGEAFVTLYLVDVAKVTAVLAGTFFGLIQLTGVGGRVLLGFLADGLFKTNRWALLAITSGLTALSYVLLISLTPFSSWLLIVGIMLLLGLSVASSWGILSTLVGDVVEISKVAMASAAIFFLTNVAQIFGSVAYGNILKLTNSSQITMGIFLACAVITVLIFASMAVWNTKHD